LVAVGWGESSGVGDGGKGVELLAGGVPGVGVRGSEVETGVAAVMGKVAVMVVLTSGVAVGVGVASAF